MKSAVTAWSGRVGTPASSVWGGWGRGFSTTSIGKGRFDSITTTQKEEAKTGNEAKKETETQKGNQDKKERKKDVERFKLGTISSRQNVKVAAFLSK